VDDTIAPDAPPARKNPETTLDAQLALASALEEDAYIDIQLLWLMMMHVTVSICKVGFIALSMILG